MRGVRVYLSSPDDPDDSPPEKWVQGDTENEQEGQKTVLPLHNAPPEPAPPLHPLPSPSSYQSPQTTTLAARGKCRPSLGKRSVIREVQKRGKSIAVCTEHASMRGAKKVKVGRCLPKSASWTTLSLECRHHHPQRFARNLLSPTHKARHCRGQKSVEIPPSRSRVTKEVSNTSGKRTES